MNRNDSPQTPAVVRSGDVRWGSRRCEKDFGKECGVFDHFLQCGPRRFGKIHGRSAHRCMGMCRRATPVAMAVCGIIAMAMVIGCVFVHPRRRRTAIAGEGIWLQHVTEFSRKMGATGKHDFRKEKRNKHEERERNVTEGGGTHASSVRFGRHVAARISDRSAPVYRHTRSGRVLVCLWHADKEDRHSQDNIPASLILVWKSGVANRSSAD